MPRPSKPPARAKRKRAKFATLKFLASTADAYVQSSGSTFWLIPKDLSLQYVFTNEYMLTFFPTNTFRYFKTFDAALSFLDTPAGRKLLAGKGRGK